jgi:hypothetical protein
LTSSGTSNFQMIRQNFWYKCYNSGIYYITPWKWNILSPETKNSSNSLKP